MLQETTLGPGVIQQQNQLQKWQRASVEVQPPFDPPLGRQDNHLFRGIKVEVLPEEEIALRRLNKQQPLKKSQSLKYVVKIKKLWEKNRHVFWHEGLENSL